MRYFKCTDCWRIYPIDLVNGGEFDGCKCVNIRFKEKADIFRTRVIAWLSKYL